MAAEEAPMPSTNPPSATDAKVAACMASNAGGCKNGETTAVPSRRPVPQPADPLQRMDVYLPAAVASGTNAS